MGTHPIFESDFDCLTEMAGTISNVEHILRTMSQESSGSETSSVSSVQANRRLHQNLQQLPSSTIEPNKPIEPIISVPSKQLQFFVCQTCEQVSFQNFDNLLIHQNESHKSSQSKDNHNSLIKRYICSRCKLEFKNAYLLGKHMKSNSCIGIQKCQTPDPLFNQDKDGYWTCRDCDYKVKTKHLMSQHLKFSHFQRKSCFVSRDENRRKAAISYRAEISER